MESWRLNTLDKDEALEKLLEANIFDHADCIYGVEEFETSKEWYLRRLQQFAYDF